MVVVCSGVLFYDLMKRKFWFVWYEYIVEYLKWYMCIFVIVGIFYDNGNYDLIFVIIGYLNYILDNLKV